MEGQSSATVAPKMSKEDNNEMDEEQRQLGICLQQVLTNPLVCENIASFLSLADKKAASGVSRLFLQAIRGTRRFAQTAVLAITDKNLEDIKSFMRKTDYTWRGVKVDVTDPTIILEDLPRVLKSVEFVSLEGRPWMIEDRAVRDTKAVSLLTAVLSSTPNLTQLKIDIRFLSSNVGGVLSSPAVQQTLRNLKRLNVVRMPDDESRYEQLPRFLNSKEEEAFWRNFGLLTDLPKRLKCFKLTERTPSEEQSINSLHRSVLRLLRNNRATLEQLSLRYGEFWIIQELQTLVLPALKTLTTTTSVYDEEEMTTRVEFLNNQTSLEELTLECDSLDERLMASIGGLSGKLKKLDLETDEFPATVDSWSFLGGMTCLEDFRFEFKNTDGPDGVGLTFLTLLPNNQLQRLRLESISTGRGFWYVGGVEKSFGVKTELLEGFRCLWKLSFVGSRDAVDDQLMQWLLKEFSLLEELEISDCGGLTDAGITGKTTGEWGRDASFADLRRLKTLKILRCRGVTPNGVLASCVNVPWLKTLEYSNPPAPILPFFRSLEYTNPPAPTVESLVLRLVAQNPRLERLRLDYYCYVGDLEKIKAKVKKTNPRVELLLSEYD